LPHETFIITNLKCVICCENAISDTISTSCKHVFHYSCLMPWLRELSKYNKDGTCPCCREVFFKGN
ncbi:hypothetical protein EJ02DRAFT_309200, partial [Clathrospora elynae]